MAGLVRHGFDVALEADGIPEDQRDTGLGQSGLIAPRRLAFPVVEVQQAQVPHGIHISTKGRVHLPENRRRPDNHLIRGLHPARQPTRAGQDAGGFSPGAAARACRVCCPAVRAFRLTNDGRPQTFEQVNVIE
jgi:hypothetical protein